MAGAPRSPRRYPRTLRVNEIVREALADELERLSDPRLSMVTITGVDVAPDLRTAAVYYADLGRRASETRDALRAAAGHLRAVLGRQVRLKYLPRLEFELDPAIEQGQRVEEIIRTLHRPGSSPAGARAHDGGLASARGGAGSAPATPESGFDRSIARDATDAPPAGVEGEGR